MPRSPPTAGSGARVYFFKAGVLITFAPPQAGQTNKAIAVAYSLSVFPSLSIKTDTRTPISINANP